jgi:outer membrane protein assembly factor BamB
MNINILKPLALFLLAFALIPQKGTASHSDWAEWRGPARDGISQEKGLPTKWSPAGENLAWKAPYGGRSAPIVMGDRVFLQNPAGKGATLQERVMCLNADTGKLVWEYRFNVFSSDVPTHRTGWASPCGDPTTGNVYALGVGGTLIGLSNDGKLLWERNLVEEFGLLTTHGGRTVSPIVDGDIVIVSGPLEGWGENALRRPRFLAFDKRTGESVWVSQPAGRPYDTTYAPPIIATINGTRLLICGTGDGAVHALKPQTGELVWNYLVAKRGLNTGVVVRGSDVIVSHSEENYDTSEMGLLASVDGSAKGTLGKDQTKWSIKGWQGGFSSPILDGDRIYQVDNGANLQAFDANSGKVLWTQNLGTIQKASPVFADGKLYVGTENGKFFILKPGPTGCEVLDEDQLGVGSEGAPEQIIGSVAVSKGRIFLVSDTTVYCIGKKNNNATTASSEQPKPAPAGAQPAYMIAVPADLVMAPGQSHKFRARLFDDKGQFIREEAATWSVENLKGEFKADGTFTAAASDTPQGGRVKATIGNLSAIGRVRIIPSFPWSEDFSSIDVDKAPTHWVNTDGPGKYTVRELEGNKVLMKKSDQPLFKRARAFMGPITLSNYTTQADIYATEKRRQMGDAGVVAQRYQLTLYGSHQRLMLESWQPETERTIKIDFPWKANTWYRLKLEVQNLPDGKTRARGKAWLASEPEPQNWIIERIDPTPNRHGSPGIYADAPYEIYIDNVKVTANK